MGKFARPKVREYEFVCLEQFVCDICEEVDEGYNIDIFVSCAEAQDYITAIMATGRFKPQCIEYGTVDMIGYDKEYYISLTHIDGGELYMEKCWNDKCNKYIFNDGSITDIVFISQDVSKVLYDQAVDSGLNIVLFDIED